MTSDTTILRNHIKKAWDKAYHLKYKTNPPKNVDRCLDAVLGNLESCFTELGKIGIRGGQKMNLTELEKDVILNGIGKNEYLCNLGDPVWSWSIADNCKLAKKEQVPGIISSLIKKGLVVSEPWEDLYSKRDQTVELTEKGVKEYKEIKEEKI